MAKKSMVNETIRLYSLGMTPESIAKHLGIDVGAVEYVIRRYEAVKTNNLQ